jgi:hypothetical protein
LIRYVEILDFQTCKCADVQINYLDVKVK